MRLQLHTRFREALLEIILHARHADLAEDFEGIVRDKLLSLSRFNIVIESIKVEVQHEANPSRGKKSHLVTLTSHGAGPFFRAEGIAFNDLAAFDLAVDNFDLQIRKAHERSKDVDHESVIPHLVSD